MFNKFKIGRLIDEEVMILQVVWTNIKEVAKDSNYPIAILAVFKKYDYKLDGTMRRGNHIRQVRDLVKSRVLFMREED